MGRTIFVDYRQRHIMLDLSRGAGTIHEGTAEGIERIIIKLEQESHNPIHFFIHGHDGGDFYSCLKIAHAIQNAKSAVIMVAFKRVYSGAFLLAQAGEQCLATPGTRFKFHHATDFLKIEQIRDWKLSQKDYGELMRKLQRIDAMQLLFFTMRGRPIRRIFDLFDNEASLSVPQARQLHLVQGVFDSAQFARIRATLYATKQ